MAQTEETVVVTDISVNQSQNQEKVSDEATLSGENELVQPLSQSSIPNTNNNEKSEECTESKDEKNALFLTCDGDRPFKNAMQQYNTNLDTEIQNAKAHLATNPNHEYARVRLRLF